MTRGTEAIARQGGDSIGSSTELDRRGRDATAWQIAPERPAHRSTAAVAGHPLHPAVVPIPIGLLSAAAVSDIGYMVTRDSFFARMSRWLIGGGLIGGVAAGSLGLVDFATVPRARGIEGKAHATGNAVVLALSAASLLLRRRSRRTIPGAATGLTVVAAALLAVTGWLGGELTFRRGIGMIGATSGVEHVAPLARDGSSDT